jgi:hypothetical protein
MPYYYGSEGGLFQSVRRGRNGRKNDLMAVGAVEALSSVVFDQVGLVVANDSARSSFTVVAGGVLVALDGDLKVLGQWPLGQAGRGCHASSPDRGLALVSGRSEVRLLGQAGRTLWSYPHPGWADYESGCSWFDAVGEPHAVVPAFPGYCRVIRFDLDSGAAVATARIRADPAGISPVHHRDGWVGLSVGEGQDAARAWWARSAPGPGRAARIEMMDGGWDDWVLSDAHPSGRTVITTPHRAGPLVVRSFPRLEVLLSVDPPRNGGHGGWDFTACFTGDLIVAKLLGHSERLAAIDLNGQVHDLAEEEPGELIPAAHGTWLSATRTAIRRCRLA